MCGAASPSSRPRQPHLCASRAPVTSPPPPFASARTFAPTPDPPPPPVPPSHGRERGSTHPPPPPPAARWPEPAHHLPPPPCHDRLRSKAWNEPAILGWNATLRALPGASTTLQNHRRRFGWLANDVSRPSEPLEAARRHSKWSRDHPETTTLFPALFLGCCRFRVFRVGYLWVKLRPLGPSDRPDRPAPSLTILGCPPAL